MTTYAATLVAIEGIDGSGKGTQAKLLHERLNQSGISAALLSFPRYETTRFGKAIGDFLNGRFGELDQVHPTLVSLLYAADRFESRDHLLALCEQNQVVVLDRYIGSNLAHQGAKCNTQERNELLNWIEYVEFDLFKLPQADLNVLLNLPVQTARQLIWKKAARAYTDQADELQEADGHYLNDVHQVYLQLARHNARWQTIECVADQELRSIDAINNELWQRVAKMIGVTD